MNEIIIGMTAFGLACYLAGALRGNLRGFSRGHNLGWVDRGIEQAAIDKARRDRRGRYKSLRDAGQQNEQSAEGKLL